MSYLPYYSFDQYAYTTLSAAIRSPTNTFKKVEKNLNAVPIKNIQRYKTRH